MPSSQPSQVTGLQPSIRRNASQWEGIDLGALDANEVVPNSQPVPATRGRGRGGRAGKGGAAGHGTGEGTEEGESYD